MPRGWDPGVLPVVPLDGETWTVAEACLVLGLNSKQGMALRNSIQYTHVFPVGQRRSTAPSRPPGDKTYSSKGDTQRGRYAKVYKAEELIELVELLGLEGPRYVGEPPAPLDRAPRSRRSRDATTPPDLAP